MYQESIDLLNRAIADELTAVHQYMYFHFHCDDQGVELLAALFRRTAIEEMMHIEKLAERILFLKGEVVLEAHSKVEPLHEVAGMLEWAVKSEESAIQMYNTFAQQCASHADSVTKSLFEGLVNDENRHFGQFDDEVENVRRYGASYLAQQVMERSRAAAVGTPGNGGA